MSDPLISATELADRLGDVTVLDVRYRMGGPPGREEHAAGHVPGAAYVDLDADLAGEGEGRHPLPDPADFQAAMRRAGVRGERPVVVYDDWAGRAAARCWWLLRWAGHDDVRVLDGGWSAWEGPCSDGPDESEPGDFTVRPGAMPVVTSVGVREGLPGVLVDARAPERFRGDVEPVDPVGGHIPGALNVPTDSNLGTDGRFRTVEQLREVYAGVGGDVAVYCGSGVTACHDVLALERIGVTASLYPGSWSAWVSDSSRPVATGD
jgi:thiosulfate/3-mercaptopyruvate sulfurtransferase